MLDENEFLGPLRHPLALALSPGHPFVFHVERPGIQGEYLPAESNTGMFGGNSNWRGPVWMPVNALIVRALLNLYAFYGDDFKVECPTGRGKLMTCSKWRKEIVRRLTRIFLRDARRPAAGLRRHRRSSRTIRTGGI